MRLLINLRLLIITNIFIVRHVRSRYLTQKTRQYAEISILKDFTARDGEFVGLDYLEMAFVRNEKQARVVCSI